MSAEESVLQLANRPALVDLQGFLGDPTAMNMSRLVSIPVLFHVLKDQAANNNGTFTITIMSLCRWIYDFANEVLARLCLHSVSTDDFVPDRHTADWKVVRSSLYFCLISCSANRTIDRLLL